jgi:hypothetical protein
MTRPPGSRYRQVNLGLALASVLVLAAPWTLTLTPAGDGLLLMSAWKVPELCLRKRLTGHPARSCHLGRSVVLASQGALRASLAQHPGGVLLVGWVALHGLLRLVLGLARWSGRRWWLDLTMTASSLFVVSAAVAALRSPFT